MTDVEPHLHPKILRISTSSPKPQFYYFFKLINKQEMRVQEEIEMALKVKIRHIYKFRPEKFQ